MANNLAVGQRIQSLLDELLDLLEEYDQASLNDAILSVKKEIRLRVNQIKREIVTLSERQDKEEFSN